jgi:tRNA-specific 2-thiouridylase
MKNVKCKTLTRRAARLVFNSIHSQKPKVIVAMSGGVDSSVAAALLKRAGFDIVGVFMKLFKGANSNNAEKVAKKLNIPFKVLDLQKEFKKKVIDYFLEGYRNGITPNPCVVCNKEIKFGLFLEKALAIGADYIATGHYARVQKKFVDSQQIRYSLISAKDKEKDQSYFLWMLNQKRLKRILFPVGNYKKAEVRKLAKKFKLPVFKTPESQEVCFIPRKINDFFKKHLKQKPGQIIDAEGRIRGQHQGLAFYTIGQRKGIGLPGGPYYVLDKNFAKNLLVVTKNEKDLLKKELVARNVNWISPIPSVSGGATGQAGKAPIFPFEGQVKIRYRSKLFPATIYKILNTRYKTLFNRPQRAVTPGQSVVFFKGKELLGGGIIT